MEVLGYLACFFAGAFVSALCLRKPRAQQPPEPPSCEEIRADAQCQNFLRYDGTGMNQQNID